MSGRLSASSREIAEDSESGAHPNRAELETFMRGEMPSLRAAGVVRHLITGCSVCLQVTRRLWNFGEPSNNRRDRLAELPDETGTRRARFDLTKGAIHD